MTSYKGTEPYIFISYSHKDKKEVFTVIERLCRDGYHVWYDEGIDPGSEWDNNIAQHIKGCSFFISFISDNFIHSNNCIEELSYARDLNKARLLVFLKDVQLPDGITMRTSRLQSIHKYKYTSFEKFISVLYSAQGMSFVLNRSDEASSPSPAANTATKKKPAVLVAAAILAIVLIVGLAWFIHSTQSKTDTLPAATTDATSSVSTETASTSASDVSSDSASAQTPDTNDPNQPIWKGAPRNTLYLPPKEYYCKQREAYLYFTESSKRGYSRMRFGPDKDAFDLAHKGIPDFETVIVRTEPVADAEGDYWTLCEYETTTGWIRTDFIHSKEEIEKYR